VDQPGCNHIVVAAIPDKNWGHLWGCLVEPRMNSILLLNFKVVTMDLLH